MNAEDRSATRRLRDRSSAAWRALGARISPAQTRSPTLLERLTVRRLSWARIVELNRNLELVGKLANALWLGFIAITILGVDWKDTVEGAVNGGRPVRSAAVLAIVLPTFVFVAARSLIGFARWRLQRELWRRDVERLGCSKADPGGPG